MKSVTALLISTLPILLIVSICPADTLYLKNGRVVEADAVWEQSGLYMYSAYGATVGISKDKVARVTLAEKQGKKEDSFQFDVWPFGTTVNEAFNIAQKYDLPLHRHGIITVNKKYHPQVRKYPSATHFYYNTNLLGHFAKVELFFTPKSKQLHTVQIKWTNQQTPNSPLINEIISMISGKYGKYQNTSYKAKRWLVDDGEITHKASFNTAYLNYLHTELTRLAKLEQQQIKVQKVEAGSAKDQYKF